MELNRDNYYDREADWEYMSCSQYQGFCECEAKQMAKLQGRWVDEPTEALIVGNYFHSKMEGEEAHKQFCDENFDRIFKTKTTKARGTEITGKYAAFELADKMLETAYNDRTIRSLIERDGEVEKILTGTLFGIPWRIRMDKVFTSPPMILDWKTSADIYKLTYNPLTGERETFIESAGYMMRAAVYSEIWKQNNNTDIVDPIFVIAAFTKQDPPAKGLFTLNHKDRYQWELEQIHKKITRIKEVKSGFVAPHRCGKCDYCRATAKDLTFKPYYTLKPENWEEWEVDEIAITPISETQTQE